ncbi:MAG: radical SAM protein [Lachnospiraceae bacterium]|nr:radical SAM protein [Lachnospiraceae bacterium]
MGEKLKVLLIRPKYSSLVANLEPLGLEYLAGLCRDLKIECEILDEFQHTWFFRYNRIVRKIKKNGYNFIGFNANANTVDYIKGRAGQLKNKFKDITIMVGGPEAELNYKDFCTDDIDLVYHDNGLQTLKNIWESNLKEEVLEEQSGICYKRENEWIIKEKGKPVNGFIVKPDRTEFYRGLKKNFIFMKGKYAISKASFSCPFHCSFCYCTKMNSGIYTERDIDEVIEEVESIDHDKIWFVDDTFFFHKERVKLFCEKIIEKGIKKQFMAYARADFIAENPDILPLAYRAGFRDLLIGLEAVNDEQLKEYNKQTSKNDNVLAIKHCHENNIVCNGLFVVSHKSTKQDFRKLIDFIKENNLLWPVFGIFTPYKGTDAYEQYKDQLVNFKAKNRDGLHVTIPPEHMSAFMFQMRYYWLHVLTYPKVLVRTLFHSAYDTKKKGWF